MSETATSILDSAARTLAVSQAASMEDIAEAAGIGRATLYRHFATRAELLEQLADYAVDELAARLREANLDEVAVEDALARIMRATIAVGDRYAVLVRERVQGDRATVERKLRAPVRRVFLRGRREGILRDDVDVEVLLDVFRGLVGAAVELAGQGRLGLEDAAAVATETFLDGARA